MCRDEDSAAGPPVGFEGGGRGEGWTKDDLVEKSIFHTNGRGGLVQLRNQPSWEQPAGYGGGGKAISP